MIKEQIKRAKELGVTDHCIRLWVGGVFIQDAMPFLTADEREYILTGITAEEWDRMFGEEE